MIRPALKSLVADLSPLRDRAFRWFWTGRALSLVGAQIAATAVLFQVWEATGSPAWTGLIGLAHAVPTVTLGFVGGELADRLDRRRLLLATTAGQLVAALALAVQAGLGGLPPGWLLTLIAGQAGCAALGAPAARTVVPRLLPKEQLAAGLALIGIGFQVAMLAGPVVAGLLLAAAGPAVCYAVDAASFVAALVGIAAVPSLRPDGAGARPGPRSRLDGVRFAFHTPPVRAVLLIDLAATVLAMPVALFPALNSDAFGGDPRTLGLLLSALGMGGVVGSLLSGRVTRSERPARRVVAGGLVWGVALGFLGLAGSPVLALLLLGIAGMADTTSVISRGAVVQGATPDAYRGRVGAVEQLIGGAGPDLGNVRAGAVGSLAGARAATAIGGLACCLAILVVERTHPALRGYRV